MIVTNTDVDADAALLAFAAKGRIASAPPKDAVIRLSDMETADAIFERNGRYELETRNRSSAPRVIMSSESLESVRRYLVLTLGVNVRAQLRLPSTALPSEVSDLPEGFELDDSGEQVVLQWDADADGDHRSARFPRNRSGMREAVSFAHVARMSEHELIDALLSPRGVVVERAGNVSSRSVASQEEQER
jgi:hypothetical protein